MRRLLLGVALTVGGCGSGQQVQKTTTSVTSVSFKTIAPDTLAMVYLPSMKRADVEAAAREQCAGKQWCKVLGWPEGAPAGTAMPLTDREAAAQTFDYTINRASGMDEAKWLQNATSSAQS